ncbi:MAG: hypothetical protein AAFV53_21665 [Myxococcota bacterium]
MKARQLIASLVGLFTAVAMLWFAPELIRRLVQPETTLPAPAVTHNTETVDLLLSEELPLTGAVLLAASEEDGVRRAVYRLPPGASPQQAAEHIRLTGEAVGVELYVTRVDGLDAEIRAYAGPALRQQLLLIPTLPSETRAPRTSTLRERPLIALIVAGLGETATPWIASTDAPLTIAVKPYQPFSLDLARTAARAWHEVLVDLRGHPEALRDADALSKAMSSVPFCTGVLSEAPPRVALPDPFAVFVQVGARGTAPAFLRDHWVPAQTGQRRSAAVTLRRTRLLSAQGGAAAMVLEADDPGLPAILDWAEREEGFRVALASEVLRADQVRGDKVTPKPK